MTTAKGESSEVAVQVTAGPAIRADNLEAPEGVVRLAHGRLAAILYRQAVVGQYIRNASF
jgi:hypothetical protein